VKTQLTSQLAEEIQNVNNEGNSDYAKENNFDVQRDLATQSAVATRTAPSGHKVRLTLRADEEMPDEDQEENEGQENNNEEDNYPQQVFVVEITNPSSNKVMRIDAYTHKSGELVVDNMSFPASSSSLRDPTVSSDKAPMPEGQLNVDMMPSSMQETLFEMLEAVGVDDDLAVFAAELGEQIKSDQYSGELKNLQEWAQF
jgi:hypothetical protein